MENIQKNQPVTYTYHKDATTVAVPIKAWQMLNQAANELRAISTFVAVMEQVGDQHMGDGTLLPVFADDLEAVPGVPPLPNGQVQRKIKDSFWIRGEKPLILKPDGMTTYDIVKKAVAPETAKDSGPTEEVKETVTV